MNKSSMAREMLLSGRSQSEVVEALHADPGMICRIAKQMGLTSGRPEARTWTDADIASIRDMAAAGVLQRVIAEGFGVSATTISQIMKRHGIKVRKAELPPEIKAARQKLAEERDQRRAERRERQNAIRQQYLARQAAGENLHALGRPKRRDRAQVRDRIAEMLLDGKCWREIGTALGISPSMARYFGKGLIVIRKTPEPFREISSRALEELDNRPVSARFGGPVPVSRLPSRPVIAGPFSGHIPSDQSKLREQMRADAMAAQARMAAMFAEGDDEEIAA